MPIRQLVINHFRNLSSVTLNPFPGVNIFHGKNASGKTSLLEAIYFLGLGRSFRTSLVHRIINNDADRFSLFAISQRFDQETPIGIERSRQGERKIRLQGKTITSLAPLAKELPLQLLTTDSHSYFKEGPKYRRQFLDWGVFHVEQTFYSYWYLYHQALKQCNTGLKKQLSQREIEIWHEEMNPLALLLDQQRTRYVGQLHPILTELLEQFLPNTQLKLKYYRGWPENQDFSEHLRIRLPHDRQLGYTHFGPHRADLQLYYGKVPVFDFLSQGQQKLAAYALHLAQGILLQRLTAQCPIYLIDDLPSELDSQKRSLLTKALSNLNAQIFITGILLEDLTPMIDIEKAQLFHVKQGEINIIK